MKLSTFKGKGVGNVINRAKRILKDSTNIVILSGVKLMEETGLCDLRGEKKAYDMEMEYGFSPEEMLTEGFFERRTQLFFKYYRNEVLQLEKMIPTPAHEAVTKLEEDDKLKAVITRTVYGLYQEAGVNNVIEINGSIHRNICPRCGRNFTASFIKNSPEHVPHCPDCQIAIRPKFTMFGARVDNGKVSRAAEAVSSADTLILAGAALDSPLGTYAKQYYRGEHFITINDEPEPDNPMITLSFTGKCSDILPQIVAY